MSGASKPSAAKPKLSGTGVQAPVGAAGPPEESRISRLPMVSYCEFLLRLLTVDGRLEALQISSGKQLSRGRRVHLDHSPDVPSASSLLPANQLSALVLTAYEQRVGLLMRVKRRRVLAACIVRPRGPRFLAAWLD